MQITQARTNDSLRRSRARRASLLGWLPVAAAVALSGCTVKKTETPDPTGPSELGLSLELRVSPDVLVMDGVSQSTLTVTSRDSNGNIQPNTGIRVEITAGGQIVDVYGRLSTKNITTGGDGRATVVYTAPNTAPSQNSDSGAVGVTLIATPAGYDYRNALSRQVDIRLVPQGTVLPQAYAPMPRFTFSPNPPAEEQDVTFDGSSSTASCLPDPTAPNDGSKCIPQSGGVITSYQWDFGNGQTGSGVRPITRYSTRGTYVVKLVVTNDRGLSNQVTQTVTVSGVSNPTVDFAVSPSAPGVGQQVFFDANAAQAAPGRTITNYQWDVGDGYFGRGVTESHRFDRAGAFNVTLTVTDSAGRTAATSKSVTVGGTVVAPTAQFTISPAAVAVGQSFFVDGAVSTATPGRTIVRYQWNFGDNQILEGARVEYVYNRAGTHTITLTVTDSNGATDTETKTLAVSP
jgi:PKD repeat protein